MKRFLKDETGLELSEYAVAAALVAIGGGCRIHSSRRCDRRSAESTRNSSGRLKLSNVIGGPDAGT